MRAVTLSILLASCAAPQQEIDAGDVFIDVYKSLAPAQRDKFVACMGGGQAFLITFDAVKKCTMEATKEIGGQHGNTETR